VDSSKKEELAKILIDKYCEKHAYLEAEGCAKYLFGRNQDEAILEIYTRAGNQEKVQEYESMLLSRSSRPGRPMSPAQIEDLRVLLRLISSVTRMPSPPPSTRGELI